MALQGTIETFALPDVMQLLASTHKTGCLRLDGGRGSGSIWVSDGKIVGGDVSSAPHADGPIEVVFELLRFRDGDFVFDADVEPESAWDTADVAATLSEAEEMLEEWKSIEAVVPSLDSWVTLAAALPDSEVTIDGARWELIVAVAGGISVDGLAERFSLGEMPISKRVKELVEAGLAEVGEAPPEAALRPATAREPVEEEFVAPVTTLRDASLSASEADAVVDEPDIADSTQTFESTSDFETDFSAGLSSVPEEEPFDPNALIVDLEPLGGFEAADSTHGLDDSDSIATAESASTGSSGVDSPTDAAEIARQLANLSPKAARAVAAAAKATTDEERERALADVDDEEESINRDLLIKFLGSVNG